MLLQTLPLVFALAGLVFYVVLGGADFGAGLWQLTAGRGPEPDRLREHTHHAMGPVWEANHVWLIFVLTVTWTAYPQVFASIASTLSVPLFVAAIGIILRGGAYALRPGMRTTRERRAVETVFSVSSILTPFALGAMLGGVAAGRVPVGNAAGDLISSWLEPARDDGRAAVGGDVRLSGRRVPVGRRGQARRARPRGAVPAPGAHRRGRGGCRRSRRLVALRDRRPPRLRAPAVRPRHRRPGRCRSEPAWRRSSWSSAGATSRRATRPHWRSRRSLPAGRWPSRRCSCPV